MYLVVDIGSNTIRAVVFRRDGRKLLPVLNKKYSAGLASYIDKHGRLNKEGITSCIDILSEIKLLIDEFDFDGVYPFATASLRNISNTKVVISMIKECCGMDVRVLSGKEEAFFDYYAAVRECAAESGILTDIGGGSTEVVLYSGEEPQMAESLPIGSLNMYNRFVNGILPSKDELKHMEEEAFNRFEQLTFGGFSNFAEFRSVGGTARAALKLYNRIYGAEKSNTVYDCDFLKEILSMAGSSKELERQILKVAPERIHTLLPGMCILYSAAKYYDAKKIVTGSHGVREGYLYYILRQEGTLDA